MVAFISVTGGAGTGGLVEVNIDPTEVAAASAALNGLTNGATNLVHIDTSPATPPGPNPDVDIYNFGTSFTLSSDQDAVAATGIGNVKLHGHSGGFDVLIGNAGADTLNGGGGDGVIIAGNGHNLIQINDTGLSGGNVDIHTGVGSNTVNLWGGDVTVTSAGTSTTVNLKGDSQTENVLTTNSSIKVKVAEGQSNNDITLGGNDKITLFGGHSTVNISGFQVLVDNRDNVGHADNVFNVTSSGEKVTFTGSGSNIFMAFGQNKLNLSGNDTIHLGSGTDTIKDNGPATVYSGSGKADASTSKGPIVFYAGSGNGTMLGGLGDDTFVGGSGNSVMKGGYGDNYFMAAGGADTMDGSKGGANIFDFRASTSGGAGTTYRIEKFHNDRDTIHLVGYDTAAALASATVTSGGTTLTLDDGTKVFLHGFTGALTAANFG
jgi:hypothetical protein